MWKILMSKIIKIRYIGHVFFYLLLTALFQVYTHCWLKFAYKIYYYLCLEIHMYIVLTIIIQVKYLDHMCIRTWGKITKLCFKPFLYIFWNIWFLKILPKKWPKLPLFTKKALDAGVFINLFQFFLKLSRWPMLHV